MKEDMKPGGAQAEGVPMGVEWMKSGSGYDQNTLNIKYEIFKE